MVLSRLTKITGPGVATDTNWVGNNADFTGITTTATSFNIGVTTIHSNLIEAHNIKSTGIITATGGSFSGNVTAVDGTFSGNVSIAGTLTYEDVTNIDAVGIITAPALDVDDFVSVGSNIHLGNAGVVTATSFVGSGAALTGIDATAIKDSGGNVKIQAQASGAIHSGVSTFQDIDVDGHTNLDNVSIAGVVTATTFSGSGANLTSLPAGQLTGTVADARISTLTASKLSGALPAISGANLTNLNGSNIVSGTVPVARIGTGTKNTSTFYRGDGTFATVTAPAITAINSASNNRIVTSDGGTTVTAESTLTYNGSGTLEINDSGSSVTIRGAGVTKHEMGASASDNDLVFVNNKDQGNITSNIIFKGSGAGGESIKERIRIDSGGRVQIGGVTGPNNAKLFVAGTNSTNYVTIRNTSAADSSGSRWSSVRFQGTQSGGEVSDLVQLQANHEGSSDDQKGAFQIQINDGNDGDSLQERMHLYSTNSTSQPIVKFISSNSGEMLNLQNSSGGGQGMVFGVDTSGSNDTTYLRNNTSSHFDFTFYMGSVNSTYERIRITQDEFRNSTQFYSNKTEIASNKTITTSYNHMSIGNMTINSGVTVTVNSGARWVIV